ncbi:MAG: nucleotidyltransferase family protein [Xanthomonadaceae bacterium]|nr:nucleotidyltransferase family protein [Xanthomonadaceae bacterium]
MLPPLKTIEATLRRTTEALAAELASPGGAMPAWSDFDWRLASAAAAAHGVSPLLCKHSGWMHPPWRRFLECQHEHVAIRHRKIEMLLQQIDDLTRASGLAAVRLKGAALHALGAYAPGDRPMADIDLLIREDDLDRATRLLEGLGYVQCFDHWRHRVLKPATGSPPAVLGEHRDTPINIELHTHIRERLPVSTVDITDRIYPRAPRPGLNTYPSMGALMGHLLLHAAGNICAHSLRLMHLHDIALLAIGMPAAEWKFLWSEGTCWWAWPPLSMVARYYPQAVPDGVLARLANSCRPWLRMISRRQTLTRVSCSEVWLHAFPGLEWARSPTEAMRFIANRIRPPAEKKRERADMLRTQLWLHDQDWVTAPQRRRILTWLTRQAPRMDTMYVVRMALESTIPRVEESPGSTSAAELRAIVVK